MYIDDEVGMENTTTISRKGEIGKALIGARNAIMALGRLQDQMDIKKLHRAEKVTPTIKKKVNPLLMNLTKSTKKEVDKPKIAHQSKPTSNGQEIDLKDLCSQLGINPSMARGRMRKHNIEKPYKWSGSELDHIKSILK